MSATEKIFLTKQESALLRVLSELGSVKDSQGFATRKLVSNLESTELDKHPTYYLRELEDFGFIQRSINGKRTYSISITNLGLQVLNMIDQLIEDADLSKVSSENLTEELYARALAAENPDHSACEAEIANLNNRLATVRELMNDLESGRSAWLDVAPKILHVIQP